MYVASMEPTAILDAIRTWLDELAEVEDQFAWLRGVALEERTGITPQPAVPDEPQPQGSPPQEILLSGEARGLDAEELGKRVASEPTLGGQFENAEFTPARDAGAVGVLTVRRM